MSSETMENWPEWLVEGVRFMEKVREWITERRSHRQAVHNAPMIFLCFVIINLSVFIIFSDVEEERENLSLSRVPYQIDPLFEVTSNYFTCFNPWYKRKEMKRF
ncbi:unnamed protein product [Caenorhabditis sp. 36 PRJEB53466]|nr:unnamed protein product [Caenorhabditis sp. 36 PRJEB53466]